MRDVFIVGVGQTPVSKETDVGGRHRAAAAVKAALADAGVEPERVGALYVGNMMSGLLAKQQQLGGLIADYAGLPGIEALTVEAACASGGAAARAGYVAVAGGAHEVVVICGIEQMAHVDRDTVTRALATAADQELEGESFLSLNAQLMRAYMDKYGVRAEDFAPFAVTAHHNAVTNPNALLRKEIDVDGYLASRVVSDPVRLFDASPICDGSAAIVLASAEAAAALGARTARPDRRVGGGDGAARVVAPLRPAQARGGRSFDRARARSGARAASRARPVRAPRRVHDHVDPHARVRRFRRARHGVRGSRPRAVSRSTATCRSRPSAASKPADTRSARPAAISSSRRICSSPKRAARIRFATRSSRSSKTSAAPARPS